MRIVEVDKITSAPTGTPGKGRACDLVADMLKQSTTREEVCAVLGWASVSMQDQAMQAGVSTLYVDKSRGRPYAYTSDPHYL